MKASELMTQEAETLQRRLIEELKLLFSLRMQKAAGELQQTHLLAKVRRNVARIKTVLTLKRRASLVADSAR